MLHFIKSLLRDERGVSAMEYAVLAGIVVTAVVAIGTVMSDQTTGLPALFKTMIANVSSKV